MYDSLFCRARSSKLCNQGKRHVSQKPGVAHTLVCTYRVHLF